MTQQQEIFGAVCELLEWDPATLTPTAKTRVGKVTKELVAAGATVDMVLFSRKAWDRMWGTGEQPTLTDTALIAWWPEIAKRYRRREAIVAERAKAERVEYEDGGEPLSLEENRQRWRDLMARLGAPVVKGIPE